MNIDYTTKYEQIKQKYRNTINDFRGEKREHQLLEIENKKSNITSYDKEGTIIPATLAFIVALFQ